MRIHWGSLRVRLAALGFAASYLPALLLFGVILVTDSDTETTVVEGGVVEATTTRGSPWITATVLALAPLAAASAWWWAGRAVGPIERVRTVAERIEAEDLGRRIGLTRGPTELVALAASFDAMLDRLQAAARAQRELIEEASHELRVPLAVLVTNAEVLLGHPEPTVGLYREGLEWSRRSADRLRRILDELLLAARRRARTIDRRPADLVRLVGEVVAEAEVLAAAKRIRLAVSGPAAAPCRIDRPTVARAVANLVDNAIRYAPAGTTVEVGVETTGDEAVVVVTDHGPGIAPAERERVFDRFWRGSQAQPGTGLGLPIARQIAEAHGGRLTLTSPGPAGDGCGFRLTLRR